MTVAYTIHLCCLINRKVKSFKETMSLSEQCTVSKVPTSVRSAVFRSGFYRATPMHSADYAVARCLSVCLSVCPSVTRQY